MLAVADKQLHREILDCDLTLSFRGLGHQCGDYMTVLHWPCFPIVVLLFTFSSPSSFRKIRMEMPKETCLIHAGNLRTQRLVTFFFVQMLELKSDVLTPGSITDLE